MKETEKLTDKVTRLSNELQIAKLAIQKCNHVYSDPIKVTRVVQDSILSHYEGVGSDPEPVYKIFDKKEIGWQRECGKCGFEQYTTKTKPTQYEPDFN